MNVQYFFLDMSSFLRFSLATPLFLSVYLSAGRSISKEPCLNRKNQSCFCKSGINLRQCLFNKARPQFVFSKIIPGRLTAAECFYSTNVSICLTCLNINLQTSFEWLSMSWSFYIRFQFINRCLRPDEEEVKSRADYERRSGFQFRVTASMSLLKMPLQHLNPHIMCVLCGGYLVDATTIIECLHSCKWKLCHRLEQIRDRTKRWIKFDERALNQKF